MALSDEEIRRNLTRFAADWGGYRGTERSEAQTFCNELLECYGTTRKEVASFEERTAEGGFIDMIWPEVCLIEMKRPSEAEKLEAHREQGLNYWMEVSKQAGESGLKAPEWIVLCAFERFEVLDPDAGWDRPVDSFPLAELPERLNSLKFLAGEEPYFRSSQADLSREAVAALTDLYAALRQRRASDLDTLRVFVLQIVWAMFAEDLGLIQNNVLSRVLEGLVKDSTRSSADDLGQLFRYLAEGDPRPHEGVCTRALLSPTAASSSGRRWFTSRRTSWRRSSSSATSTGSRSSRRSSVPSSRAAWDGTSSGRWGRTTPLKRTSSRWSSRR